VSDRQMHEELEAKICSPSAATRRRVLVPPLIGGLNDFKGKRSESSTTMRDFPLRHRDTAIRMAFAEVCRPLSAGVVDCGLTGSSRATRGCPQGDQVAIPMSLGWRINVLRELTSWNADKRVRASCSTRGEDTRTRCGHAQEGDREG